LLYYVAAASAEGGVLSVFSYRGIDNPAAFTFFPFGSRDLNPDTVHAFQTGGVIRTV
jgi:hypothetical protein